MRPLQSASIITAQRKMWSKFTDLNRSTSPLSTQISPSQQDRHDGFDFNSVLPGMRMDDIATLNVDYTALDDLEDGIEHWRLAQGPVDLDGSGSDQSEDTDIEIGNAAEPNQNGTHVAVDNEISDSGDKVCYGMVRLSSNA
jgi:hypothetical protein